MVGEGVGLRVGEGVGEGSVGDGPAVGLGMGVRVEVGVTVGVGGSPVMMKRPDIFQLAPVKICTSYSPGNQPPTGALHSV